ncbi:MAG: undecaprenyldiphospho-muramoylpentapeptide beta-N-acetylglucosaminyltransferase [Lachnospiraceae bacterium]|nr:undecaprenyldiphospho-muramoylpentapeptide beta-N-acetylglucosaminyltransferase [Lachnospiraceae bacterium]
MKKIVLTGGGTAGHITPNIALLPELRKRGYDIEYIGSIDGMEKEMIAAEGVPYHGISTGKLRRYLSARNLTDPFRIIKGYFQARSLLKKIKPDVIFSKGGYVSVPVVYAAKSLRIPSVIHESDMTPGLANKLCFGSASRICCNFPETLQYLPEGKSVLTGSPIRQELFTGEKAKGLEYCGFDSSKPVILVIGGSLGSAAINKAVRAVLPKLLESFQIIHICGAGNLNETLTGTPGYRQFEFVREPLKDLMAAADLVISRAGANVICELLALRKPNILIPLPTGASRGDQLINAASFKKQGFSFLLPEEEMTEESLLNAVNTVFADRQSYVSAMEKSGLADSISVIAGMLDELADRN